MFIKVRVFSGCKKEEIVKKNNNSFILKVKEKAERNMANKRVCEIIAREFSVSIKSVRIINGHQSPSKILSINDIF
ncbi:TPA: DUF167 domain-containing protein [Candidatus Nomurabacteria bacterium]|nr:MAG: hypothetical protein O210_OD1C00001G0317 [Parcubacteria bacterium RAAC4_OD1_1]HCY26442.1 DUF167 domain-containing protein [Candidatus Nomurabacteria bacterium]